MIKQNLFGVALVLATVTVGAQEPKPTTPAAKPATAAPKAVNPQPQKAENRYVPAIMQLKQVTVTGCLKRASDWELTDAALADQESKTSYKLEGIADARLSLFVGKRIQATGALQPDEGKPAARKSLPRFEATAVQEATGTCP